MRQPLSARARRIAAPLGLVVVPLCAAPRASAQEPAPRAIVTGRVTDSIGTLLSGAEIRLLGADVRVLTDPLGLFRVSAPAGSYLLDVRLLGYKTLRAPLEIAAGDSIALDVVLELAPQQLPPVAVNARRARRAADAFGSTMTREDIAASRATTVPEVLRRMAGVAFIADGLGEMHLELRRGGAAGCTPAFFLDGFRLALSGRELEAFPLDEIALIQVYRSAAELPAEYGSPGGGCGAVVIRTGE